MSENRNYNVTVIGAGAVGCAVARQLSQFNLDVLVLEKNSDVAGETSGRNSAVVHAGFNNKPGSLMAKLCVEGNEGFEDLCNKLDVPYRKTGKLVVALDESDVPAIEKLYEQGVANGCQNLQIIDEDEIKKLVPKAFGYKALYSPETAITNPFLYTVALAENAAANGVTFNFDSEVDYIKYKTSDALDKKSSPKSSDYFTVVVGDSRYHTDAIINCAGLESNMVSSMAGFDNYKIYPCRGEYYILDIDEENMLPMPVYPAPRVGSGGLGVHLTPTIEDNVLIGPSAEYIHEGNDYSTTISVMNKLRSEAVELMPDIKKLKPIGNYAGIRPKQAPPGEGGYYDFIIKDELDSDNAGAFINLIGIESPGLTASIPIANRVIDLLKDKIKLETKSNWQNSRQGIIRFRNLTPCEQEELIKHDSAYGDIVCRCRKITRGEIRDAIENPLGVKTFSGIKYRAWTSTGRCNGGYCLPKIAQMLVKEYGLKPEEIKYRNNGSYMFKGTVK